MKTLVAALLWRRALASLILLAVVLGSGGCAIIPGGPERTAREAARQREASAAAAREPHTAFRSQEGWRKLTYRNEELLARATPQNTAVEIALREQRGLLLVDGAIAMDFPVATGRASHPTPKGSYKILEKKKDYSSNLYGRIVAADGATVVGDADTRSHGVPEGGRFIGARMPYWMRLTPTGVGMHVGYVPGRPASHGCIRLKKDVAVQLFALLPPGAPVVIESFAPALGGVPVGTGSVVTGEVKAPAPRKKPRPKPQTVPATSQDPAVTPGPAAPSAPSASPAAGAASGAPEAPAPPAPPESTPPPVPSTPAPAATPAPPAVAPASPAAG